MWFSFFLTQASSTYYCLVRRPRNTFIRLPLLLTKCQLKMKTLWSSLGNLVGEPQLCHCFHHLYLALWDILNQKKSAKYTYQQLFNAVIYTFSSIYRWFLQSILHLFGSKCSTVPCSKLDVSVSSFELKLFDQQTLTNRTGSKSQMIFDLMLVKLSSL